MSTSRVELAVARLPLLAFCSIVGLSVGIAIAYLLPATAPSEESMLDAVARSITPPNPQLTPDQVVRLQLASLAAFRNDELALLQCYVLASPANRGFTGPFHRFAAMVSSPQFAALVDRESELVGRPVVRGNRATVLVTVVDDQRRTSVFRFFLSKQADRPYRDCWMTDAVTSDSGAAPPVPSQIVPSVAIPQPNTTRRNIQLVVAAHTIQRDVSVN
jgi:hypothetical protein